MKNYERIKSLNTLLNGNSIAKKLKGYTYMENFQEGILTLLKTLGCSRGKRFGKGHILNIKGSGKK